MRVGQGQQALQEGLKFLGRLLHWVAFGGMAGHGEGHAGVFGEFDIALGILVIFEEGFDEFLFIALGKDGGDAVDDEGIATEVGDIEAKPLQLLEDFQDHRDLGGR